MIDCCDQVDPVWYLNPTTEEGWKCLSCNTELGFRPDIDRECAERKVSGILFEMHEAKLIYISNGSTAEIITSNVERKCFEENRYDQWSILEFILQDPNLSRHGEFWQNRAERWLVGGEPIRKEQSALFD